MFSLRLFSLSYFSHPQVTLIRRDLSILRLFHKLSTNLKLTFLCLFTCQGFEKAFCCDSITSEFRFLLILKCDLARERISSHSNFNYNILTKGCFPKRAEKARDNRLMPAIDLTPMREWKINNRCMI